MAQGQKHTPGPWTVEAFNRDPRLQHSTYKPVDVKMSDGTRLRISNGIEGDANARLIAAAPDLLDALYTVYSRLPDDLASDLGYIEALLDRAGKPYVKATGGAV